MMRIEYYISNLVYVLGNGILKLLRLSLFGNSFPDNPQNILILRKGNLGDTICAVPAMKAVKKRFPSSRFIFMTAEKTGNFPHTVEVLKGLIEFNEIFIYDPTALKNLRYFSKVVSQLRSKKLDLVVYLSQSSNTFSWLLRDLLFFRIVGCKSACGFQWTKHWLFSLAQRRYRIFYREVDRLMKLVEPLGVSRKVSWDIPRVPLNFDLPKSLDSRPVIVIHPTAKFPVKRWPLERFLEVCRDLKKRCNPFFVVVGGSDAETNAEALVKTLKNDVLSLTGKTTFLQLAEVLRQCDLLVSCDSGPVHVAAAVGTPVVGIYSARDYPQCWYPWGEQHIVLRKDPHCQARYKNECETMDCINDITVDEVLKACDDILKKNRKNKNDGFMTTSTVRDGKNPETIVFTET
ncbi:MAG: glycosyltransferase family 9 protein [Candidatus Scalinduaceae bacterium]